mmetsp:Transcript_8772/g.12164  ORF Transcript_8772/g.12164 Transcript_8772/m.12164 type:complete len:85 (+) Transcript_8772:1176-1430(+)
MVMGPGSRGGGPEPAFRPGMGRFPGTYRTHGDFSEPAVASGQELVVEGKGPQIVPQPAGDEPAAPRLVCLASPDTGDPLEVRKH